MAKRNKHGSKPSYFPPIKSYEEYHPLLTYQEKSAKRDALSTTRTWEGIQSSAAPMIRNMDRTSVTIERKFKKRFSNS